MARGSFTLVVMIKVKIIAHWINLGKLNQKKVKVPRSGRGKIISEGTFLFICSFVLTRYFFIFKMNVLWISCENEMEHENNNVPTEKISPQGSSINDVGPFSRFYDPLPPPLRRRRLWMPLVRRLKRKTHANAKLTKWINLLNTYQPTKYICSYCLLVLKIR